MKGSVVANSPLLYVLIAIGLIGVVIFALVCAVYKCFPSFKVLAPGLVTILLIMVPTGTAKVEQSTPDGDAIALIATASNYITPALFGCMSLSLFGNGGSKVLYAWRL